MSKIINIVSAEATSDLCVLLTFNDGKRQKVDVGAFIRRHPHPMYNRYLDPKKFAEFHLVDGNIHWGANGALEFPVWSLYQGNPELCCDEE